MSACEVCRVCGQNLTDEMFNALLDRYYQRGADDARRAIVADLQTMPVTGASFLVRELANRYERKEDKGP